MNCGIFYADAVDIPTISVKYPILNFIFYWVVRFHVHLFTTIANAIYLIFVASPCEKTNDPLCKCGMRLHPNEVRTGAFVWVLLFVFAFVVIFFPIVVPMVVPRVFDCARWCFRK